jgi:hypothetical protein
MSGDQRAGQPILRGVRIGCMTRRHRSIRNVSPIAPIVVAVCVVAAVAGGIWPLWFLAAFVVAEEWWRSDA